MKMRPLLLTVTDHGFCRSAIIALGVFSFALADEALRIKMQTRLDARFTIHILSILSAKPQAAQFSTTSFKRAIATMSLRMSQSFLRLRLMPVAAEAAT